MNNNDILRRLRYALDISNPGMIEEKNISYPAVHSEQQALQSNF